MAPTPQPETASSMPASWRAETLLEQIKLHMRLSDHYPVKLCTCCRIRRARTLICLDCMADELRSTSNPEAVDAWIEAQTHAFELEYAIICNSSPTRS